MRTWIKSACVVLAWSILPVTLVATGTQGSVRLAQANTRTASSTEVGETGAPLPCTGAVGGSEDSVAPCPAVAAAAEPPAA